MDGLVGEPVGGRRAREGLRKLHPPSRAATLRGVARERRLRTETVPPPANAVSPGQGRGRLGAGLRRPTRRVKGRIGAGSLLQGARVARIAECCLEQKVGYGRHTDHPQQINLIYRLRSSSRDTLGLSLYLKPPGGVHPPKRFIASPSCLPAGFSGLSSGWVKAASSPDTSGVTSS